jgi:two-component system sensor histidine kinase HydH
VDQAAAETLNGSFVIAVCSCKLQAMTVNANQVSALALAAGRGTGSWRQRVPEIALALALLLVAAFLLQRIVTQKLLEREGEITQQFLQSVVQLEKSEATLFAQPSPSGSLMSFIRHVDSIPGMLRLNVYSPDGIIRHSSEPNLVGIKFADNAELARSFGGSLVIKLEEIKESDKAEHVALQSYGGSELIEAYLPLKNEAGEVFTVVEFYRKPDGTGSALGSVRRAIWYCFAAIGLFVMAYLLAWQRRAGGDLW